MPIATCLEGYGNPSLKFQNQSMLLSCAPKSRCSTCQNAQLEGDAISHLISFLITLREPQQPILQLITDQADRVLLPSNDDRPAQRVTLVNNKDPVTAKHSSGIQEPLTFLTCLEVKAIVMKGTRSSCSVSVGLMPPYAREVTNCSIPRGTKPQSCRNFDGRIGVQKSIQDASSTQ